MSLPVPSDAPSEKAEGLATVIGRVAALISSENFPTGDRAKFKRMDPGGAPPLVFIRFAMNHLPHWWESRQPDWLTVCAGLALMCPNPHRSQRPAGRVLAESRYAEARLERLLASSDAMLRTLLLRAARYLAAKGEGCDWLEFAGLLGMGGSAERARLKIAREYYRQLGKDQRKE